MSSGDAPDPEMLEQIFRKIFSSSSLSSLSQSRADNLVQFLTRAPAFLATFPQTLHPGQGENDLQRKREFLLWLVRRLLYLWTLSSNLPPRSSEVQLCILRLLHINHPQTFRLLCSSYLDLLEECVRKSSLLFDPQTSRPEVELRTFAVADEAEPKFKFCRGSALEGFQTKLTRLLSDASEWMGPVLINKAWILAATQVELADVELKAASLCWAKTMIAHSGLPSSMKVFRLFHDTMFSLAKFLCSEASSCLDSNGRDVLESELELCLQEILSREMSSVDMVIFSTEVLSFWGSVCRSDDFVLSRLSDNLTHMLSECLAASVWSGRRDVEDRVTDFLIHNLSVAHVEALACLIMRELKAVFNTSVCLKATKKKGKKRRRDVDEPTQHESLVDAMSESPTWSRITHLLSQHLASNEDSARLILVIVKIAKRVSFKAQTDAPDSIAYLSKELVCQIVQELIQHVLQDPEDQERYAANVQAFEEILYFQPLETLTQSLLQQILALATLPWMSGEVKLADLRVGDTLAHSMMATSSRQDAWLCSGISLVATMQREVCPKWRMHALKKAWAQGRLEVRIKILEDLPNLLETFGTAMLPLSKEFIGQASSEGEKTMLCAVAKTSGLLVCVQARQGLRKKMSDREVVECRCCKRGLPPVAASRLTLTDVEHLLKLVGFHEVEVRLHAIDLVGPLSVHVGFDASVTRLWLNYLQDEDEACFAKFCHNLPYLIDPSYSPNASGDPTAADEPIEHFNAIPGWEEHEKVSELVAKALEELCETVSSPSRIDSLCRLFRCLLRGNVSITERVVPLALNLALNSSTHAASFFHLSETLRSNQALIKNLLATKFAEKLVTKERNVILEHATVFFGYGSPKRFLVQQIRHILPALVLFCSRNDDSSPIEFVAKHLGVKSRKLLAENIQFIFPYLVTQTSGRTEYARCTQFLEKETVISLKELLPSNRQKVITELMVKFHAHKTRVVSAFSWLAKNDDGMHIEEKDKLSTSQLVAYILPRFLGVLGYFDQRLVNSFVPDQAKKEILESLKDIIEFMGPQSLSPVKHKLLATFKTAQGLKMRDAKYLALRLWETFVKTIDLSSVGPILAQIIASLYTLYDSGHEDDSLALFKFLIVDNEKELKPHFSALNFLPEHPGLQQITDVVKKANGVTKETSFSEMILKITRFFTKENSDVKIQILIKLKQLLSLNQGKLQGLISASDQVEPEITNLVNLLVDATRDPDSSVVKLAGQCLGHIGAIDPGRLDNKSDLSKHLDVSLDAAGDPVFARKLLEILVGSFLKSSESSDSDACAYSLQEVLKAFNIEGPRSHITKLPGQVWNALSDFEREVLTPFLTSLYSRSEKSASYSLPIYKSKKDLTYQEWLADWSCHLIDKLNSKEVKVFTACKAALRKDTQSAQFLLPYIITSVLLKNNSNDANEILEEMEAVIGTTNESTSSPRRSSLPLSQQTRSGQLERLAIQTVFTVMDHLNKWLRGKYLVLSASARKSDNASKVKARDVDYSSIEAFVRRVSQRKLAQASFHCQAHARALMHLESHLRQAPSESQASLFLLQRIAAGLQDTDYVVGVTATRQAQASLQERIFHHQVTGNYQDALGCYEGAVRDSPDVMEGMLECYNRLDQPNTVAALARGLAESNERWVESKREFRMEAAWQLAQWDELESLCSIQKDKDKGSHSWRHEFACLINCLHRNDSSGFYQHLQTLHRHEVTGITAAAMEEAPYQRSYTHVVNLQVLNEVESIADLLLLRTDLPRIELLEELFTSWRTRSTFAQYSLESQEPVLKVRRALLELCSRRLKDAPGGLEKVAVNELGVNILISAKAARKAGQFSKAFNLLIDAERFPQPALFLERAKLLWTRHELEQAISVLKKGIQDHFPWYGTSFDRKDVAQCDLELCASAKLRLARYVDEAANLEAEYVPALYVEARSLATASEEVYYHSANFYDKVIGKNYKESDLDMRGDIIYHIMGLYGRSLLYGCRNIHQSLARMLSLWFDYGSRVKQQQHGKNVSAMVSSLKKMNDFMVKFLEKCPTYYFLVVFPQLSSRICHANDTVWSVLRTILVRTFVRYPNQVFWHMVALSKSSFLTRSKRCAEIFNLGAQEATSLKKFVTDGTSLADRLHHLAETKLSTGTQMLDQVMPTLIRVLSSNGFSQIMIPTTKNMSIVLPTTSSSAPGGLVPNDVSHRPFPSPHQAHFQGVENAIVIMRSLVAPKKVTFLGSDGLKYAFLCKPKDDLRRDCRLIDFNNLLNKLFLKNPECRKRDLRIRTYKVIPLNETSGIIEWVENLTPLRNILVKLHRELLDIAPLNKREFDQYNTSENDVARNRRIYDQLKQRFPPVFAEWFARNFPDPQTWWLARRAYVRTTAVMSMVGYLLGLGDRHAENIMFDSSSGDTVHVDLNCLFNKGDELKIPEVVPFRLTRNMVQAMGPTGYEGPFRIACEVSLGLMRRQKDLLMSALRPFYFDPLVDWVAAAGGHRRKANAQPSHEVVGNEIAVETLKAIEKRLEGLVTAKRKTNKSNGGNSISMPLSVAGQVNFLIKEAVSEDNLSQMYLGWAPYY